MKKIVALFDIHVPDHINLNPVFEFIKDWKPTHIVIGGDAHSYPSVSAWDSDQSRNLDGGTIKQNHEELNKIVLEPVRKASSKAQIIYLEGNHEYRLVRACASIPNLRNYAELKLNIPKDIKLYPMNIPYRANENLVYVHGIYINKYHARATVEAYHTSVIYGHVHSFQSHTTVSPVDYSHFYKGQSIGSLSHLNPDWMKNRPNAWVNGFSYTYVENGSFWDTPVVIVKNTFWALGRRYK